MIPAYGFGANINGYGGTWHKFALNGDVFAPECNGIDGVEQAYKHALTRTRFNGPTNFSKIIEDINDRCEAIEVSQNNQEYHVLVILTDGIITDKKQTID